LVKKDKFGTFLLVFFLFSIYIFVFSESGILERIKLNNKFDLLNKRITDLKYENMELNESVQNNSAGNYSDSDILRSGYTGKGGNVLIFKGVPEEKKPDLVIDKDSFNFNYDHLRIIWIIISVMIIIIFLTRKNDGNEFPDE